MRLSITPVHNSKYEIGVFILASVMVLEPIAKRYGFEALGPNPALTIDALLNILRCCAATVLVLDLVLFFITDTVYRNLSEYITWLAVHAELSQNAEAIARVEFERERISSNNFLVTLAHNAEYGASEDRRVSLQIGVMCTIFSCLLFMDAGKPWECAWWIGALALRFLVIAIAQSAFREAHDIATALFEDSNS